MKSTTWKFGMNSFSGIAVCLTLWASSSILQAADLPLTSFETKPEEGVFEDRHTQYLQTLRLLVDDGDANSMIELANELLLNKDLKKDDLSAVNKLISAAQEKLGAEKVESVKELYNKTEVKFNNTSTAGEPQTLDLGLSRPKNLQKAETFASCAALITAASQYAESAGKPFPKEFIDFQSSLAIASVLFSDFDKMISYYTPRFNSYSIQIERYPEQLKHYLPSIKQCMDSYKNDMETIKKYEKSASEEFYTRASQ
ncbi:hypothetical protein D3C77_467900 [compost metagenome]